MRQKEETGWKPIPLFASMHKASTLLSVKTKPPGLASGRFVKTEFRRVPELAGVKLDDELLVDERVDVGAVRDAGDSGFQLVLVHGQPVLDRHGLREVGHAVHQLLRRWLATDFDHVAGLHLEAGDVNGAAIHLDMAVVDGLTGGLAAVAEASAVNHVVETSFQKLKKDDTGNTTAAGSFFVVTAELLFEHAVLEPKLLFFAEGDGVFTLLFTTGTDAVLAGWEIAAFKCLRWAKEGDTKAAADLCAWTCITCHIEISESVGLDAAGLLRAATVVRNRRHIAD